MAKKKCECGEEKGAFFLVNRKWVCNKCYLNPSDDQDCENDDK